MPPETPFATGIAELEATQALRRRVTEPGSEPPEASCAVWLKALFGERVPGIDWEDYRDMQELEGALAPISKVWTDQWQANALAEGLEKGLKKGREEGLEKGREEERLRMFASQRSTLEEQVRGRFGGAVAAAFAEVIETVEDPAKLTEVAMRVGMSEKGEELLESVRGI